jgi:hypothetical protein
MLKPYKFILNKLNQIIKMKNDDAYFSDNMLKKSKTSILTSNNIFNKARKLKQRIYRQYK